MISMRSYTKRMHRKLLKWKRRVTSSDFDKIKVTGMHQVTMQEAVGEASYEDIPVEEVSSVQLRLKSLLNAESPGRRKRRF